MIIFLLQFFVTTIYKYILSNYNLILYYTYSKFINKKKQNFKNIRRKITIKHYRKLKWTCNIAESLIKLIETNNK